MCESPYLVWHSCADGAMMLLLLCWSREQRVGYLRFREECAFEASVRSERRRESATKLVD